MRIDIEELAHEILEPVEVYSRLWIEPFEIDIDYIHFLAYGRQLAA